MKLENRAKRPKMRQQTKRALSRPLKPDHYNVRISMRLPDGGLIEMEMTEVPREFCAEHFGPRLLFERFGNDDNVGLSVEGAPAVLEAEMKGGKDKNG